MLEIKEHEGDTVEQLRTLCLELSKEIYEMDCQLNMAKKLDRPDLLRKKKKDRARIMTLLNRKIAEGRKR